MVAKEVMLARIDKRIKFTAEGLWGCRRSLLDAKNGVGHSRVGSVAISTSYNADDVRACEDQVAKHVKALQEWREIRRLVEEAPCS